mgnify:CR=1 FL=1
MLYSIGHTNWSRESNTIWVNSSLHLNTINQFQIRFKTRFTTKTPHRDNLSPVFAMSHNRRVQNVSFIKPECVLWYWVDHWTQTRFESLTIFFDNVIVISPQRHRGTCRKSSLHTVWIVNTMERRMQNFK